MVTSVNLKYPNLERFDTYYDYGDVLSKRNKSFDRNFIARRHKATTREINIDDKLKATVGSVVGTVLPMIYLMKVQKVKNPFKINYGLKEMILMSGSAVTGGVLAGMLDENRQTKKNRLKEGVFQFLNASVPAWVVAGGLKLCESSKNFNNLAGKILAVIAGLLVGMYGAASLSNVICDPKDKENDRKLTLLDCVANADDAFGALVLAKFPCADKLHLEKILPFIYAYCGYRAGKSN